MRPGLGDDRDETRGWNWIGYLIVAVTLLALAAGLIGAGWLASMKW